MKVVRQTTMKATDDFVNITVEVVLSYHHVVVRCTHAACVMMNRNHTKLTAIP